MRNSRKEPARCLGICLFYEDEDIVRDAVEHLLENNHELLVWDHGSTDGTPRILDEYRSHFVEHRRIPREVSLEDVFEKISRHVMSTHAARYDWISFPESDEFLEGPDRSKTYYEHVLDVLESPYDWVQFHNVNYWFTAEDDPSISSPVERIRRYCVRIDCAPRVYAWRASKMNVRVWNQNPAEGKRYPTLFNTRHYQIRSEEQMRKRFANRRGLAQERANWHFETMPENLREMYIRPEQLHFDDGTSELDLTPIFDWSKIYPEPRTVREFLARIKRRVIYGKGPRFA